MNAMISSLGGHALEALTPDTAVRVERSRCVRHRCSHNECRKCLDICPTGAVTWDNPGLSVNPDTCTQCLRCLTVCPTAALRSPEMSVPRILSELAEHETPVLGCSLQSEAQAHARMPCLGYLAHPEVMTLLGLVYRDGLQINLTHCGDCANGHMVDDLRATHARLRGLVSGHRIALVWHADELDYQAPALSRRELFTLFRQRSTRAAAGMVARLQANQKQQTYGDKKVPPTRTMLLAAMEGLPVDPRQNIADQLFGRITFTAQCVGSGRCVGVCPTGAIDPTDEDDQPPTFDRDLCVSCNSCQAFCGNQGVELVDG